MNDITPPPKRPLGRPDATFRPQPPVVPQSVQPASTLPPEASPPPLPKKKGKLVAWVILGILGLLLVILAGGFIWYQQALSAVDGKSSSKVRVEITSGSSPDTIGALLEQKKLIRSKVAFDIYTRLSGTRSTLQAGVYSLSPAETTGAIVAHLVSGKTDKLTITFLPGATLEQNKQMLRSAGYSDKEINEATGKLYSSPLFADKPDTTDLEGYIYGETYTFETNTSVEKILTTTFNHYEKVIQEDKLVEGFKRQNLNLYEGITLASIIQREVSKPADQKQVAQVFLKRLAIGMPLGSDVTYQYAAKKLGVTPTPELDSPYNTRKVAGLPPGPIASPGRSALDAVANPAAGDYLFFLSGDDNITYFARTAEEHEANIRNHCQQKCSIL